MINRLTPTQRQLCERLDLLQHPALFLEALSHTSYTYEAGGGARSYERLEFLGDAVVDLVVGEYVFQRFPGASEGDMQRMRASIVCEAQLAETARALGLDSVLCIGRGEEAAGGRVRPSLLCDVFEAVVAAVFLAHGWARARAFVLEATAPALGRLSARRSPPKGAKAELQEFCQANGRGTPIFRLAAQGGSDHDPWFEMEAVIEGQVIGRGRGRSKKAGGAAAARDALERMETGARPASSEGAP